MREVEPAVTAGVAHQATLTDQAADRRTLAYVAAFFLAASTLVVLLVLAPGRRRSRTAAYDPARALAWEPGLGPGRAEPAAAAAGSPGGGA